MKKYLPYLKNKFILASTLFLVFVLFLDENDIFSVISQKYKLRDLKEKKAMMLDDLHVTTSILDKLKYDSEIEKYAREKKFFKKDDEDVFVIFEE
ncbi:MAG: hypothetical protein COA33_001335 [Fluviicola sp.]|nr:hypothetical protein [Fluviicola sp.]